jgi:hypothetical protein
MASQYDLGARIQEDFTKHGWTQFKKGRGTLYERPLSMRYYNSMVHPKKSTISRRTGRFKAVKRLFSRWFM